VHFIDLFELIWCAIIFILPVQLIVASDSRERIYNFGWYMMMRRFRSRVSTLVWWVCVDLSCVDCIKTVLSISSFKIYRVFPGFKLINLRLATRILGNTRCHLQIIKLSSIRFVDIACISVSRWSDFFCIATTRWHPLHLFWCFVVILKTASVLWILINLKLAQVFHQHILLRVLNRDLVEHILVIITGFLGPLTTRLPLWTLLRWVSCLI